MRVVQGPQGEGPSGQRRVRHDRHAVRLRPADDIDLVVRPRPESLVARVIRVSLALHDGRLDRGEHPQPLERLHRVVAHTERPQPPSRVQPLERPPDDSLRIDAQLLREEIHVDVVQVKVAGLPGARVGPAREGVNLLLHCAQDALLAAHRVRVAELGGDVQLTAGHTRTAKCLAHELLVVVALRAIEVPIPEAPGGLDNGSAH
eukprot:3884685-Prymnesium_polylepis.1